MPADAFFAHAQARRLLEEVNHFILSDAGEIIEAPGKISLVWTDPVYDTRRYLSVKAAGNEQVLINGRRFPATQTGIQQGLRACLMNQR